jgi:hypothetical protein
MSPLPHLRTETDLVSEMLFLLKFRIPDNGQSPKPSNSKHHIAVLYVPQNMILVKFVNFSKQSDGQIEGTGFISNSDVEIFLYITICLINSSGASDPRFNGYQQLSF